MLRAVAEKMPSLEAFSGDAGYRGTAVDVVEKRLERKLPISRKSKDAFAILPKRWIVERTFAWPGNYRRLAKDDEKLTLTVENMARIAMLRILLKRYA